MRSVKFGIAEGGHTFPVNLATPRGYDGPSPIVEVVDVPDDVTVIEVMRAHNRCGIVSPVMYADHPIPWDKIKDAVQGTIIRLTPGRPAKDDADKAVRINITLTPEAIAMLDALGGTRSGTIERLIRGAG